MKIQVVSGDIAQVPARALITAIGSGDTFKGAIDEVIRRCAGEMFHDQVRAMMRRRDGQVVIAPSTQSHSGTFSTVVFVIDDLQRRLRDIVRLALQATDDERLDSVVLPVMRTGVMAGHFETVQGAMDDLATAVRGFADTQPAYLERISVAVYHNPSQEQYLRHALGLD